MIVKCEQCYKFFDDQFRSTICPHDTFSANDGWNNFKHYPESWLADHEPRHGFYKPEGSNKTEYQEYQNFLNSNKVKINE